MAIDLTHHRKSAESPRVISLKDAPQPVVRARQDAPRLPHARKERSVLLIAIVSVAVLALIAVAVSISRISLFSSDSPKAIARSVAELILVPDNETPTIAEVSDLRALEGQVFFQNAALGDKVLMYLNAQKAILYRPSENKIIEVGPITGGEL
jgi:hypothetical protein